MQARKFLTSLLVLWVITTSPYVAAKAPNQVKAKHPEQHAIIKNLIFKQLSFYKLKNAALRPLDALKYGKPIRNPFIKIAPQVSLTMLKEGINLARMARFDAFSVSGGEVNQKLINKYLKTVLVIGSDAVINETIYSRGPVVILGNAKIKKGIIGEGIVWYSDPADYVINESDLPLGQPLQVGLPLAVSNNTKNQHIADFIIPEVDALTKVIAKRKAMHVSKCWNRYATSAVAQFKEGESLDCGFTGLRWSGNIEGHAKWCETIPYLFALQETQARDEKLAVCKAAKS